MTIDLSQITEISNWTVKRAGAGMTIEGLRHPDQLPVKIANIKKIECRDSDGIFAVLANEFSIRLRGSKKR